MPTGPGGSNPYTFFLEKPSDRPSPTPPSDRPAPLRPDAYDNYGIQVVADSEKPQPVVEDTSGPDGQPLEPNPFFTNVTPNLQRTVEAVVAIRREEERERLPTRQGGDAAYERYHGRYDFGQKEWWQSKKVSPKLAISVERLVASLARIREKSKNWFDVEATNENASIYYNFVKALLKHWLDHDEVDFDQVFRTGLKTGLLQQLIVCMVTWETDGEVDIEPAAEGASGAFGFGDPSDALGQEIDAASEDSDNDSTGVPSLPGQTSKLRIEVLNPDYVYLDSSGRDRRVIWEMLYSKGEARYEGEARSWDMEALERALSYPVSTDDSTDTQAGFHEARDAAKQDKLPEYKAYSKVKITNICGDIEDPNTGDILHRNVYMVIANDKEVVYGPIENPFWHGNKLGPIIHAPIIETPFAAYGRSPIVWNLDMYDLWIEYLNMLVDYMRSILLGMKEVDMDLVEDYEDTLRDGLFPGKFIPTSKGGLPNLSAITNVPFSDVPQGFWQHLQILQKELSDNVLLADTIGGDTRTRGRITALEFNRRATDAGAMIDFVFGGLEKKFLAKVIRYAFYCVLQFMPQKMWTEWIETHSSEIEPTDPQLKAQWDAVVDEMKTWTPTQRWNKLGGFFKFKVRVFSSLGDQQMEIEKGTFFMQTIAQIPGAAQHIKWDKMLRHITRAFGWDPEEIISADALPLPQVAALIGNSQLLQALQQQQGAGGLPGEEGPSLGAPTSLSTSPPFAPASQGAPGPGGPPETGTTGPGRFG